jgi:WD40 repeat protein
MLILQAVDEKLSSFAADGSRFVVTFADVIAKSAPHIYLSALPFTPPSSPIYTCYYPRFPRTVRVLHEGDLKWSPMRLSLSFDENVIGISIHPEGKRLAVGLNTYRGTVRVVDITTGETLFSLEDHWSRVRTVVYSPSGTRIATGAH